MTAEQQLERSVLEGKERDELHAIAQALSVKTNTRTKKADMIDGILKATGVSVDDSTPSGPAQNGRGRIRQRRRPERRIQRPSDGTLHPGHGSGGRIRTDPVTTVTHPTPRRPRRPTPVQ